MLLEKIEQVRLIIHLYLFIADAISYLYLLLKIYRVLCFSKITFDQLPVINPYKWPASFIRIVTKPYFKFWSKLLPNLKIGSGSYDISTIIGLEVLNNVIALSYKFRMLSLLKAQTLLIENS